MKIKPYEETHMQGFLSIENSMESKAECDFGVQIAEDGRVWICIDGVAFIRFRPTGKYKAVGRKLMASDEE